MQLDKALQIPGWMSPIELEWLASLATQFKIILEVGCYKGRSTRAMADNTIGKIIAIDPWNTPLYNDQNQIMYTTDNITRSIFYSNLSDKIKDGIVEVMPYFFHDVNPHPFDLWKNVVFIDANHRYDDITKDINHALKFKPTIIAGHDYCQEWPGVVKAVNEIFPNAQKVDSIWFQQLKF